MRALLSSLVVLGVLGVACTSDPDDPISNGEGPFITLGGSFTALRLDALDGSALIQGEAALSDELKAAGVKSRLVVVVEDRATVCQSGANRQNAVLFNIDALSDQATFAPGTFTQKQTSVPGQVDLSIQKLNATCGSDNQAYGTESGTVTVTTVSATTVKGTFEVTLQGGAGTLSGTFNVPICPTLDLGTCQP